MQRYTIRTYQPSDAPQIAALQAAYGRAFPGVTVQDAGYIQGFYGHPAFDGGQNILCACAADGKLQGYGFLFAKPPESESPGALRYLFVSIVVDPGLSDGDALREALFAGLHARARAIAQATPQWTTRLQAVHFSFEEPAIGFLTGRDFTRYGSGLLMARDLRQGLPESRAPEGIEVRAWRMETEAEQLAYLRAHNEALPISAMDLDGLRYFMGSRMWAVGTTFTAFAQGQVVGSMMAYWDPGESQSTGSGVGSTEEVFVLEPWRRRGIARCLIGRGMRFLFENGLCEARLEMDPENTAALALYRSLGYRTLHEEVFLHLEM